MPLRRRSSTYHEWTPFELNTLLCLMAKGLHQVYPTKRKDDPTAVKQHAYLNVATELNKAVNNGDYAKDIDKMEVARMIDQILKEKKGAIAVMERQRAGRITRTTRRVLERVPPIDFDGSELEWKSGRKDRELIKELSRATNIGRVSGDVRRRSGDGVDADAAAERAFAEVQTLSEWRLTGVAPSLLSGNVYNNIERARSSAPSTNASRWDSVASSHRLPLSTNVCHSDTSKLSSAAISTYNSNLALKGQSIADYTPPTISLPAKHNNTSHAISATGGASYDMYEWHPRSTISPPKLTPDKSSSPSKPQSSRVLIPFDAKVVGALHTDIKEQRLTVDYSSTGLTDKPSHDTTINPERRAMLSATSCEEMKDGMEMDLDSDEEGMLSVGRKMGSKGPKGANMDPLPFNRLEMLQKRWDGY